MDHVIGHMTSHVSWRGEGIGAEQSVCLAPEVVLASLLRPGGPNFAAALPAW